MAERKYTGTDAELLRMKREGRSLREIAAAVGIGKSVVGARIARAEATELARAETPASMQAMSKTANRRGASTTSSSDLHVAGPINVRAELEALVRNPKTAGRERLGALQAIARMDGIDTGAAKPAGEHDLLDHIIRKPGEQFWLVPADLAKEAGLDSHDCFVFTRCEDGSLNFTYPFPATAPRGGESWQPKDKDGNPQGRVTWFPLPEEMDDDEEPDAEDSK